MVDDLRLALARLKEQIGLEVHLYEIDELCRYNLKSLSVFDTCERSQDLFKQKELRYKVIDGFLDLHFVNVQFNLIEYNKVTEYAVIKIVDIGIYQQEKLELESITRRYFM